MKILIVQLKRLGDVLLTTPVISLLKKRLLQAQIDFVVYKEYAGVLKNNPHVTRVLIYPSDLSEALRFLWAVRQEHYDWVIDFLANGASAWLSFLTRAPHRLSFKGRYPSFIYNIQVPRPENIYAATAKIRLLEPLLGATVEFEKDFWRPELYVSQPKRDAWRDVLENAGHLKKDRLIIALAPTSRRPSRRWPLERYAEAARKIIERWGSQVSVVCLWGPGERQEAERVVDLVQDPQVMISPQFKNVHDLAAFLSHCNALITNCNGTKHIAVAMGVPTVTIYMSSDPQAWNPFHPLYPILRAENLWCIGCRKNACPFHLECANGVGPQDVLETVEKLLDKVNCEL